MKRTVFTISVPIKTAVLLLKSILEKSKEIYEHVSFLWSAFLRIYSVSTFSLAFMLNSFSLLSTFKSIAVTQNVSIPQFETSNYVASFRARTYNVTDDLITLVTNFTFGINPGVSNRCLV